METSGPAAGDVANAEGAPGCALGTELAGASGGFAAPRRLAATAPNTPRDVWVKNCLRDFSIFPGAIAVVKGYRQAAAAAPATRIKILRIGVPPQQMHPNRAIAREGSAYHAFPTYHHTNYTFAIKFNMPEPAVSLRLLHGDITTLDVDPEP